MRPSLMMLDAYTEWVIIKACVIFMLLILWTVFMLIIITKTKGWVNITFKVVGVCGAIAIVIFGPELLWRLIRPLFPIYD